LLPLLGDLPAPLDAVSGDSFMIAKHVLQIFGEFAFRMISAKVDLLVKQCGFNSSDRDDLYQNFALNLCRRSAKFNPDIGNWEAFVVVVCENHFADILERRMTAMRSRRREAGSLNRPIRDEEGTIRDRAELLGDTCHDRRTGRRSRSDRDRYEMSEDVTGTVGGLTSLQGFICGALSRGCSVSAIARHLKISRAEVSKEIAAIRRRFEQANLRDYL
jgi:hypothetical protein